MLTFHFCQEYGSGNIQTVTGTLKEETMTVTPKVFLIGETRVVEPGLAAYLAHIGIPGWESDALSDSEKLIEVM